MNDKENDHGLDWMGYYREALAGWGLETANVRPLSLSENATYLVTTPQGERRVLRLHRPGFRGERCIRSELAWLADLGKTGAVHTMRTYPTAKGCDLHPFTNPAGQVQYSVLFDFLEGIEPVQAGLGDTMDLVGQVAARLHEHSSRWQRPDWLKRLTWTPERIFGERCDYGDWRDTPELTAEGRDILECAEAKVRAEMAEYGVNERNFGLIHTDLRSSNLLVDAQGDIKVLDFDDCGLGWYLFDMACSFSFEEGNLELPDLVDAYLRGYWSAGGVLTREDMQYLPCMVMARALQLVAWVEKRRETDTARRIRSSYVQSVVEAARLYVEGLFLTEDAIPILRRREYVAA
ncbi:phosphotransferase enzyme family protein [Bifidobacterium cuniculi]|uniref:Aminoglycoside phosphotransferase n=1 Tax=Bifidobacterium cuniculi TaxID=1688 RepID=A0A087AYB1_9BIFI|nr:phosphotransferase [Bifidobacterium cuniculi]KFI63761.1 aminoglycoside phosphotransferase [Bifidobacterium cuniculi]